MTPLEWCLAPFRVINGKKNYDHAKKENNHHKQKSNVFQKEEDAFHNWPRREEGQGNGGSRLLRHSVFDPAHSPGFQKITVCEVSLEPGAGVVYQLDCVDDRIDTNRVLSQGGDFGSASCHCETCGLDRAFNPGNHWHNKRLEGQNETAAADRED